MTLPYLEFNGFQISILGLGCSRLGSMMGSSIEDAETLVAMAVDQGITFFDTATSYGQGDSERILGRVVGKNDRICLVTKVGKIVPLKAKVLQPVKGMVRKFAHRSSKAGAIIKQSRPGSLPVCFDARFPERELDKSRQRLGLHCIPMVMLHSPPASILLEGDAVGVLEHARGRGALRTVGVAVDDLDAAEATLKDDRITAVQVPFYENDIAMADWAARAKRAGKLVIAREIFHGVQSANVSDTSGYIRRNLRRVLTSENIGVSLVGTTKIVHLSELLEIAQSELMGRFDKSRLISKPPLGTQQPA